MDGRLLARLSEITDEEREILNGRTEIDKARYTGNEQLIMDKGRLLSEGRLISIRPNTRFIHFPRHRHNYVEVIYMCQGQTRHIVDGSEIILKAGELLFLNQHAVQEIFPAGKDDLAVNFIILPEFFDTAFAMLGQEENLLRSFLAGCLCGEPLGASYLHFQVTDVLPVQNLVENMIATLLTGGDPAATRTINQFTMGLLLLHLTHLTDHIHEDSGSYDQKLAFRVLQYVEGHYQDGTLTELAGILHCDPCWLSRQIKKLTGRTYKDLLQTKRLTRAATLLTTTALPAAEISVAVGYDNTSYFHRIFRNKYEMSPGEYRQHAQTDT